MLGKIVFYGESTHNARPRPERARKEQGGGNDHTIIITDNMYSSLIMCCPCFQGLYILNSFNPKSAAT